MHRRNYTLHVTLAVALIALAAAAGRIERWDWNRGDAPARVVVRTPAEPAEPQVTEEVSEESDESEAEVLVRFKPGVSEERIEAITAGLNDRVEDEIESVEGLASIDDLDDAEAEEVAAVYAALPEVEYAEPNFRISVEPLDAHSIRDRFGSRLALNSPNDPLFAEQWGLVNTGQRGGRAESDVSALAAWQKTQGSKKVVVAVLDSGVDYTHPDLAGNMWHRPADLEMYVDEHLGMVDDTDGFSALSEERDPMDENGHGTHCSGIVGAEGDNNLGITGVNWRVEIMPLKFMGRGGFGSTRDAIAAINYVIARKKDGVNVRVISASWGSTARSKALEDVIRKAGEADILFVAAAGNDNTDNDRRPHFPSNYQLPNVLSVAALDRNDERASFSNYGAKTVHVAAPGKEILSTWLGGRYEEHSGTSMATPFVAGVAGLVLSLEPNLSATELRQRLINTSDKLDALKGKVVSGGRVNAARAVGAVQIK